MTTLSTGSSASSVSQIDPTILGKMHHSLKKSVARRVLKSFEEDPSLDFESVLRDASATYKSRFNDVVEGARKPSNYLSHHSNIPVPRSQGFVVISDTSYMFMTHIPGETLEKRWLALTKDQKSSVRSQLNVIMSTLRRLPHPSSAPLGSLSSPHVCKDARRTTSVSSLDLRTISQFHDFLLSRPGRGVSSGYLCWLRSLLSDEGYRITLTHGDFHPRNVMVMDQPDGSVCVSGIIDCEMGGWYPEYWEMYKAFNTRGGNDESGWWDSLLETILGFDREVAERKVIEQSTMA